MEKLLTELRAAGEATRLRILAVLRHGELTVGEIVQILGQSQPRVSRHLKLLCEAKLLDRFQEGTLVFYRLSQGNGASGFNRAVLSLLGENNAVVQADETALSAIRDGNAAKAQAYFRENAASWNEIRSLYVSEQEVEACLLDLAGENAVETLLDIGTGTGRMLELFAGRVTTAHGVDVSRDMLAIARSQIAEKGLHNCSVRLMDMYDLAYEDGAQDLVILHQVLHFADHPQDVIGEAGRVMSARGTILVADFAPHSHEFLRDEHAHRRLGFSDQEMAVWAKAAGLEVKERRQLEGAELKVSVWKLTKRM